MRFEVSVHVSLGAQAGGGVRKVLVSDKTTFRELRSLLLGDNVSNACFHRLEIQYAATFLRRKPAHVPDLDDVVERALSRIQNEWADEVRLVMIEMPRYGGRNSSNSSNSSSSSSSSSSSGMQTAAASPSLSRFFRSQSASPPVSDAWWPPSPGSSPPASSSSSASSSPPSASSIYLPNSISMRFVRQQRQPMPSTTDIQLVCTEWIHDRMLHPSSFAIAATSTTTTSDGSVDGGGSTSSSTANSSSSSSSSSSTANATATTSTTTSTLSTHPALEQLKLSKEGTPESIHRDVSCRSFKQGRLLKRTCSGAPPAEAGGFHLMKQQEEWTEMCVMLDSTRLWYYPLLSTGGGRFASQMASIVLEMETSAATKVQFTDTSLSCTTFCIAHPRPTPLCMGSGKVFFRAKSRIEAEQWVLAITAKALHERENDAIISAETLMADLERAASRADVQLLSDNARFEGMLGSALLRGAFRTFLEANHVPESLKFWEHAEDYRRGHPESEEPFDFVVTAPASSIVDVDVQAWGVAIFDTFLKLGAHYQISDCSFEESKQILEVLSAQPCPPHTAFMSAQASAYFKLKYTDGHYPTFITECRQYRKLLAASLHAHHRALCGLPLMESFLAAVASSASASTSGTTGAGRAWCRLKSLFSSSDSSNSLPSERDDGVGGGDTTAPFCRTVRNSGPGKKTRHTPWRSTKKGSGLEGDLPDWWWKHACPTEDKDRGSAVLPRGCLKTNRGHIPLDEQNTDLLVMLDWKLQAALALAPAPAPAPALAPASANTVSFGVPSQNRERYVMPPLATAQGLGNVILVGLVRVRYFPFETDGWGGGGGSWGGGGAAAAPGGGGGGGGGGGIPQGAFAYGGSADPTKGSDWMQLYALVTEFIGRGDVILYDPVSGTIRAKIHLHRVERVCATPRGLACLDLYEAFGRVPGGSRLRWQIAPLAADWEERRFLTQSWIDNLWVFSSHGRGGGGGGGGRVPSSTPLRSSSSVRSIVRVVASGFLSKRGNVNTAYQRRWFVCCSDKTLSYYKDSTWKGTIDLGEVDALSYVTSDGSSSSASRRGSFSLFAGGAGTSPQQQQQQQQQHDSTIARGRTSTIDTAAVASGSQRAAALSSPSPSPSPSPSREITLVTKKRTYYFMADSAEDAERWLQAMHEALQDQPASLSPLLLTSSEPESALDAPYRYIASVGDVSLTSTNNTLDEPSPRFSMHR